MEVISVFWSVPVNRETDRKSVGAKLKARRPSYMKDFELVTTDKNIKIPVKTWKYWSINIRKVERFDCSFYFFSETNSLLNGTTFRSEPAWGLNSFGLSCRWASCVLCCVFPASPVPATISAKPVTAEIEVFTSRAIKYNAMRSETTLLFGILYTKQVFSQRQIINNNAMTHFYDTMKCRWKQIEKNGSNSR